MKRLATLTLITAVVLLSLSSFSAAQRPAELTDDVLKQLVDRILRYEIKPSEIPRVVYISAATGYLARDGDDSTFVLIPIRQEWLPSIRNVEFKLHEFKDEESDDTAGYEFNSVERAKNRYEIKVAYGNLGYGGGKGKTWAFRIRRGKLRLWPEKNGGFQYARDSGMPTHD